MKSHKRTIVFALILAIVLPALCSCAEEQGVTIETSDFSEASISMSSDTSHEASDSHVSSETTSESETSEETELDIESYFADRKTKEGKNCYIIETVEQLYNFAMLVNTQKHDFDNEIVMLNADLQLNTTDNIDSWAESPPENVWVPIGKDSFPFRGKFTSGDKRRTISGIYCPSDKNDAALFGYIEGGSVEVVTLGEGYIGSTSDSLNSAAGFAVCLDGASLNGCYNYATVQSKNMAAGLAVDVRNNGKINYCRNYADVDSVRECGGIAGTLECGVVKFCINYGNITGGTAGGIVGIGAVNNVNYTACIASCVNEGDVHAKSTAGGIVGFITAEACICLVFDVLNTGNVSNEKVIESDWTDSFGGAGGIAGQIFEMPYEGIGDAIIKNAVNVGTIEGTADSDAIVAADSENKTILNCYYLEGCAENGDFGKAVSRDELEDQNSFEELNFGDKWYISEEHGHPFLYYIEEEHYAY